MDDLISRQAAIDAFLTELTKRERKNLLHTWSTVEVKYFVVDVLEKSPSAHPERKKGKWIPQDHNKTNGIASTLVYYYPKCSVCGHCDNYTNFCSNCGADMRGEQDE